MKIALTFLTISVVLLLGSLMWGMKTYTDLAHALSDVADLKQEVERYRSGTFPVAMPGVVAQQVPTTGAPIPAPQPSLDEAEIEAMLEEKIAMRFGQQEVKEPVEEVEPIPSLEDELATYERQSNAIDRERASLLAERENIQPVSEPMLTEGQNKIATAPILASVKEANSQYSFVVMDAGTNKNIEVGKTFSIRRNHMIIGEAKIDSVEETSAVADVKKSSVPPGVVIKEGDQIVEFIGS